MCWNGYVATRWWLASFPNRITDSVEFRLKAHYSPQSNRMAQGENQVFAIDAGQDGEQKSSRITMVDQGNYPIDEKRKANEAIEKLPAGQQDAAWAKFFVLPESRNEIQTIPTFEVDADSLVTSPAKNKGPSHAGEANFDKGPRTVSVYLVGYCVLSIADTVVYPPPLDSDNHTSVAFNLHNGIRGIRFPTDHARSDGKVCATDLQRAG